MKIRTSLCQRDVVSCPRGGHTVWAHTAIIHWKVRLQCSTFDVAIGAQLERLNFIQVCVRR